MLPYSICFVHLFTGALRDDRLKVWERSEHFLSICGGISRRWTVQFTAHNLSYYHYIVVHGHRSAYIECFVEVGRCQSRSNSHSRGLLSVAKIESRDKRSHQPGSVLLYNNTVSKNTILLQCSAWNISSLRLNRHDVLIYERRTRGGSFTWRNSRALHVRYVEVEVYCSSLERWTELR